MPQAMTLADRHQVGAAMMIDDALGVAGGARGVVERDRVPFVVRHQPGEFRIAFAEKSSYSMAPSRSPAPRNSGSS